MINIFFVPGTFGSLLEYIIRRYTALHDLSKDDVIRDNGAVHNITKLYHATRKNQIKLDFATINTLIYPFADAKLPEILTFFNIKDSQNILLYCLNTRHAELNMIFQYYKIVDDIVHPRDLGIFFNHTDHLVTNWNKTYTSWRDMEKWQLRELFSLFYPEWIKEWTISFNQVPDTFLKISSSEILGNFAQTLVSLEELLDVKFDNEVHNFYSLWREKQQYIIDEYNTVEQIIYSIKNNIDYSWSGLSIISESIIQKRLRDINYEIKCDGLNTFPTSTETLYKQLERC